MKAKLLASLIALTLATPAAAQSYRDLAKEVLAHGKL